MADRNSVPLAEDLKGRQTLFKEDNRLLPVSCRGMDSEIRAGLPKQKTGIHLNETEKFDQESPTYRRLA